MSPRSATGPRPWAIAWLSFPQLPTGGCERKADPRGSPQPNISPGLGDTVQSLCPQGTASPAPSQLPSPGPSPWNGAHWSPAHLGPPGRRAGREAAAGCGRASCWLPGWARAGGAGGLQVEPQASRGQRAFLFIGEMVVQPQGRICGEWEIPHD